MHVYVMINNNRFDVIKGKVLKVIKVFLIDFL